MKLRALLSTIAVLPSIWLSVPACASPWAEVGDAQLRSDIEVLAAAGVIDNVTMQWPLPWASIVSALHKSDAVASQPDYVRAAANRVIDVAQAQMRFGEVRASATVDGASTPSLVRGFDALGRQTIQGQLSAEYMDSTTAVRLSLGAQSANRIDRQLFVPDNSYVAQKIGGAVVYAGYLTHWWGPGWVSSLTLSNNARPIPQIGIARDGTGAFESPWLSWLGPWQMEFFVGLLDGPRVAKNTVFVGTRVAINPIPHLEIGFSRTTEMCGTGHPCKPLAYYFSTPAQSPTNPDHTNDESGFDFRYSNIVLGSPYEVYMQLMNEDNGPFVQSATSHLFGASAWLPVADTPVRLTFEYADSLATRNIFSFGKLLEGAAYNNFQYIDGMRYRGRTLGFSLDSDSRLLTLQGSWRDNDGWSYEVSYYRAQIADVPVPHNVVTTTPVDVNMGEARLTFPLGNMQVNLAGRLQDDQPRPDRGFEASFEAALTYNL